MNSVSPVAPVVAPDADDGMDRQAAFESVRLRLDEEPMPEGVALLLALFEPSPEVSRPAWRPQAFSMAATPQRPAQDGSAQALVERRGASDLPALAGAAKMDDGAGLMKGPLLVGEGLSVAAQGAGVAEGAWRSVPVTVAHDLPSGGDGSATPLDGGDVFVGPGLALPAPEESVLRAAVEWVPGVPSARSEVQALGLQGVFEGTTDERATTSGQQDRAPSQSPEQDDEAPDPGSQASVFLQVPFRNERAAGQVLISREGPGASGLLIRANDRQVFEQLKGHFEQARQPGWQLDDVTLSRSGDDRGRTS